MFSWGWWVRNGFVRWLRSEALEPFELLNGAAIMTLHLSIIAQEQGPAIGLAGHAVEAFAEEIIAVLSARDFDVPVAGQVRIHQDHRLPGRVERLIETRAEKAGFEAGGAEERLLGESDPLDGEQFLRVGGFVDGQEIVFEMGDIVEVFEANYGERGWGEAVFAVLG